MTKPIQPQPTNPFEKFRYDLWQESPRAGYWLESMIFAIMAQTDGMMTEDTALELVCGILVHPANPRTPHTTRPGRGPKLERMPATAANVRV